MLQLVRDSVLLRAQAAQHNFMLKECFTELQVSSTHPFREVT